MAPAAELVAPVLEPVRPRQEHLPATRGAHLVGAVAVEQLPAGDRVRPQPAADLDDDGALVAVDELVSARRWVRSARVLPGRPSHPCEQVVADAERVGHRREGWIHRADAREDARVDDVEVVELVRLAVHVEH